MANKTIPQLPEQTGKTNDDLLVIVDSGETTTSKIKVSTLFDGVGGGFIDGDATDSLVTKFMNPTGATSSNTTYVDKLYVSGYTIDFVEGQARIGGKGNNFTPNTSSSQFNGGGMLFGAINLWDKAQNSVLAGGEGNDLRGGGQNGMIGGNNNNANCQSAFFGGGGGHSLTNQASRWNSMVGGYGSVMSGNAGSKSILGGYFNTLSNTNGVHTAIISGQDNTISNNGAFSTIINGENNTISGINYSVILGGQNLTTSYDNEVVCEHLTTSGQSRGNFYNNLSGDTFTIDWDEGNLQKIYMTGDTSLTFSNIKDGATYKLQVENGGTHSITGITATGFTILCEGGSIPNITNNGVDLCVLEVMGTDILVRHFSGFATP